MNGPDLRIALQNALPTSSCADFCVGYFNLGGWKLLTPYLKATTSILEPYRILIGMPPDSDRELRKDILRGIPSDRDTLKSMAALLRERKVVVKISRRRQHSKFYLLYDADRPTAGFLGSSNLTRSGLTSTGESNLVLDSDAFLEYAEQFAEWWGDPSNTDFTDHLAALVEARLPGYSPPSSPSFEPTSAYSQLRPHLESSPDREILTAFYYATNGPNWINNTNWLSNRPLREWYGVKINYGDSPNGLKLVSNNLSGELSPLLENLSRLHELDLSGNQLSGEIPVQLGNLFNLHTLNLSGNRLNGAIPSQLGDLSNLSTLDLSDNRLSGQIPAQLGNLGLWSVLNLSNNQLSGRIPPQLGNLSKLWWLSLSDNQLTGEIPLELTSISSLHYLNLSGNLLSGTIPPQLANLRLLEVLDLSHNRFTGEVPSTLVNLLRQLVLLKRLYLNENRLTGRVPAKLLAVPHNDLVKLGLPFSGRACFWRSPIGRFWINLRSFTSM